MQLECFAVVALSVRFDLGDDGVPLEREAGTNERRMNEYASRATVAIAFLLSE